MIRGRLSDTNAGPIGDYGHEPTSSDIEMGNSSLEHTTSGSDRGRPIPPKIDTDESLTEELMGEASEESVDLPPPSRPSNALSQGLSDTMDASAVHTEVIQTSTGEKEASTVSDAPSHVEEDPGDDLGRVGLVPRETTRDSRGVGAWADGWMDTRDQDDSSDDAPIAKGALKKYATETSTGAKKASGRGGEDVAEDDKDDEDDEGGESNEGDEDGEIDEDDEGDEDGESDEDDDGGESDEDDEEDDDDEKDNGDAVASEGEARDGDKGERSGAARSYKKARTGTPDADDGGDEDYAGVGNEEYEDGAGDDWANTRKRKRARSFDDEATGEGGERSNRITPRMASRILGRLSKRYKVSASSSEEKSDYSDDGYDSDDDQL